MRKKAPLLAITMGDPAGCGPEIVALATKTLDDQEHRFVCIGDSKVMKRANHIVGSDLEIISIKSVSEMSESPGKLFVIDHKNVDLDKLVIGKIQQEAGRAAYEYIIHAIDLAMEGEVAAVVTSPINKEALHKAGFEFDGHTEIFSKRTKTSDVTMMLVSDHFKVTHVSTHVSLKDAVDRCTIDRILKVIQLTHEGIIRFGIKKPKLAVAGINPHSGEGGVFGKEEIDIIQPAIDRAVKQGYNVEPYPVPGDTVFVRMWENKEFDAVVAQYHDQGHIAAKLVDFWGGVNITLGIPIIRTSVDHGTAFDIAGQGKANPKSLINAINYAEILNGFQPE